MQHPCENTRTTNWGCGGKHETRNGRHSGTCLKPGSISCWPRMSLSFLRKQADLTMRTQLQRSQFSATCLLQIVEPLKQHRTHELLNVVAASRRSFSKQRIVYLLRRSCCAALRLWSADWYHDILIWIAISRVVTLYLGSPFLPSTRNVESFA